MDFAERLRQLRIGQNLVRPVQEGTRRAIGRQSQPQRLAVYRHNQRAKEEERRSSRKNESQSSRASRDENHWQGRTSLWHYDLIKRLSVGGLSERIKLVKQRHTGDVYIIKRVGAKARPKQELEILKRIPKYCHLNYMVRLICEHEFRTVAALLQNSLTSSRSSTLG